MNGSSKRQPEQAPMQVRAISNPGGPNHLHDGFQRAMDGIGGVRGSLRQISEMADAEIKRFVNPSEMAESKAVVRARMEGFEDGRSYGRSDGYHKGLACGIFCTALFFITVYAIGKVLG